MVFHVCSFTLAVDLHELEEHENRQPHAAPMLVLIYTDQQDTAWLQVRNKV